MKEIKILSLFVCLMALLTSCEEEENLQPSAVEAARTVLVYIAGNNSLGQFDYDSRDILEMIEGMKDTEGTDNNLLVYYAGYKKTAKLIRLLKNGNGEVRQETVMDYEDHNSVDVDVMKDVLRTSFSRYPAKSYGIVFWSHGEGWLTYPQESPTTRWWGQDIGSGDARMNISDLREALSVAPHFDFMLFDACFMQSVEVAYDLKEYTNYYISSPTEIPGPGAPYQKVVPALFSKTAAEINIAEAYWGFYADEQLYTGDLSRDWEAGDPWTAGVSMSVVKTSMLEQLADKTKQILPKYIKEGRWINTSGILCYDRRLSKYYYDFDGLMHSLLNVESDEYKSWRQVYDSTVIYWQTTPKNYSSSVGSFSMEGSQGLSIYIPRGKYDSNQNKYYRESVQWYTAAGWNETGW